MTFLLDTNAVSEPGRPHPDPEFWTWYAELGERAFVISAITIGELRLGIALLDDGRRRRDLSRLYSALLLQFADRILPVDARVAEVWGDLSARLRREGRAMGASNKLIAATALANHLVVVTRNRRDFEPTGCEVLSPWSEV